MDFIRNLCQSRNLYSDCIALSLEGRDYTYSELYRVVDKILAYLSKKEKRYRVGILTGHGVVSYAGVLASILGHHTFVPINVSQPFSMVKEIIAHVDIVIVDEETHKKHFTLWYKIEAFVPVLTSLDIQQMTLTHAPLVTSKINKDSIAYIMFTSGSTGKPKGIEISYKSLDHFLSYTQLLYGVTCRDRISQTFDLSFDLSLFGIFMGWCYGASLYVLPYSLQLDPLRFIKKHELTIWFSVPYFIKCARRSLFREVCSSLRLSLFCGESLKKDDVLYWKEIAVMSQVENLYGPTELTLACSRYIIPSDKTCLAKNGIVSIGGCFEGMDFILWQEGMISYKKGELCISSVQNFIGYFNQKELTERAHVIWRGKKYYRTGDIVYYEEGVMFFMGRADAQIKRRGYRIELGYLEHHLNEVSGEDVLCLYDEFSQEIIAFVIDGCHMEVFKKKMRSSLPPYMMPDHVIEISGEKLPRHHNQKLDKKKLLQWRKE